MMSRGDREIPRLEPIRTKSPETAKVSLLQAIRQKFRALAKAVTGPTPQRRRRREGEDMGGLFKRLALRIARRTSPPRPPATPPPQDYASPDWEPLAWLRMWEPPGIHFETEQTAVPVSPIEPLRPFEPVRQSFSDSSNLKTSLL